jgi:hypothetical protein
VANPGTVKPILIDLVMEVTCAIGAAVNAELDVAGWLELESSLHEGLHALDLMSPAPRRGDGALGKALEALSTMLASTTGGPGGALLRRALAGKLDSIERLDFHPHKRFAERFLEVAKEIEELPDELLAPDLRFVEAARMRQRACVELQIGWRRAPVLDAGIEMEKRMRALSSGIVEEGLQFLESGRGQPPERLRLVWIVLDELNRAGETPADVRTLKRVRAWDLLSLLRQEHPAGEDLWRFHQHGRTFGLVR